MAQFIVGRLVAWVGLEVELFSGVIAVEEIGPFLYRKY